MVSVPRIVLMPEPKACHVRTALSGVVRFSVFVPITWIVTLADVVRLDVSDTGNAQRGAGNVASGPATRAVKSNFLREKLLFSFLFMG